MLRFAMILGATLTLLAARAAWAERPVNPFEQAIMQARQSAQHAPAAQKQAAKNALRANTKERLEPAKHQLKQAAEAKKEAKQDVNQQQKGFRDALEALKSGRR